MLSTNLINLYKLQATTFVNIQIVIIFIITGLMFLISSIIGVTLKEKKNRKLKIIGFSISLFLSFFFFVIWLYYVYNKNAEISNILKITTQ